MKVPLKEQVLALIDSFSELLVFTTSTVLLVLMMMLLVSGVSKPPYSRTTAALVKLISVFPGMYLSGFGTWANYAPFYPVTVTKTNGVLAKDYRGSLLGWSLLTNDAPSGELSWIRTGGTNLAFQAGFTNQAQVIAKRYTYEVVETLIAASGPTKKNNVVDA